MGHDESLKRTLDERRDERLEALKPATGSAASDTPNCAICGLPLYGAGLGSWTDDEEYGDVHESCLKEKRNE
jgi:hypothetical protein